MKKKKDGDRGVVGGFFLEPKWSFTVNLVVIKMRRAVSITVVRNTLMKRGENQTVFLTILKYEICKYNRLSDLDDGLSR